MGNFLVYLLTLPYISVFQKILLNFSYLKMRFWKASFVRIDRRILTAINLDGTDLINYFANDIFHPYYIWHD